MLSREKVTSHGPVVRQNRVLLLNHGDEPVLVWAVRVPYCPDAAPPEASGCSGYRILSFSPRSPLGEFGSPSTACCFETETFPSSACCYRQTFLGDIETVLVPVEACIDSRSAGYMSGVNYSFRSTTTIIPDSCWNFFLSTSCGDGVVAGRAGA